MQTQETFKRSGRDVKALSIKDSSTITMASLEAMRKMGVSFDSADMNEMMKYHGVGMDAGLVDPITAASITTPIQFLQAWLAGFVHVATAPRRADTLLGISVQGAWEDEEIVQPLLEYAGRVKEYGDYTNIPLSSWNVNFERRSIVRFEEGLRVGRLEEKRSARVRVDSSASKRNAAMQALEINRNEVAFFGYNNGANRTYGMLNDPQLLPYVNALNG